MTDAQQLFDRVRKQFDDIADGVERQFEYVAGHLRDLTVESGLIPGVSAPPPRPLPPPSTLQIVQRWIDKHRALTVALVAFVVTGSVGAVVYRKSRDLKRKRRAKKSSSGARTEVVVVIGAVANPLASALYLDLERRGFVVYVVANTSEDEHYIRSQSRVDLLPLRLDMIDPFHTHEQMASFTELLQREHAAFSGAEPHRLTLAGVIAIPDTQSAPALRIEGISSEEWSDALNAKVLNTIATTRLFLPALISHQSRILMLTPSVTPSLKPPMHAIESVVYGALEGFTRCLSAELSEEGVAVTHFKIGNIDIPAVTAKQRRSGGAGGNNGVLRLKSTPIRTLHEAVFDALVAKRPNRTWHVGRGSLAYDIIGSWVSPTMIGWMLRSGRKASRQQESGTETREADLMGSQASLTWEKVDQEGQ